MQTKVSTKGQVVLPGPLRRRLDIRAGDPLDANIEDGSIVLTPRKKRAHRPRLVTDPVTGLPGWVRAPKQITDGHLSKLATAKGAVLATLDENIPGSYLIPR